MLFTLYLIGYGNQISEQLFERLEKFGDTFLIIDVRARRRSWAWEYCAPQIEYVMKKRGHEYMWLPQLGNANGRDGQVRLVDESFGMMALETQVRKQDKPVVLLCAERLSTVCHRSVIAAKLRERFEAVGDYLDVRSL
jgi:uncharacterized protein (DUF488 family)